VACFWVTSFEKNLSAVAVKHHLFSWRWQHDTTHNIVEGLEVRGLRGRSKIGHGAPRLPIRMFAKMVSVFRTFSFLDVTYTGHSSSIAGKFLRADQDRAR